MLKLKTRGKCILLCCKIKLFCEEEESIYNTKFDQERITMQPAFDIVKHQILAQVNEHDPLGLLTPFIVKSKILLRKIKKR